VSFGEPVFLVDTSPELRLQCIANGIRRVDAVLFTHHHADHIAGLDDLRRFNDLMARPLTCYGLPRTLDVIRQSFRYAFEHEPDYPSQKPSLRLEAVDDRPFTLFDRTIVPIPLMHGPLPVLGYRFGNIAYCTDCNHIPPESLERLRGLDVLVLDGLRRKPHPTHFHLEAAVATARRIGARRTWFTHIAHALGHAATNAELPAGMALAYDGLVIGAV
jgi:phosphoribosyl 1,2-cyclic phosphate phosphodiesterase